jgi:phenylacetate-CoA ligase
MPDRRPFSAVLWDERETWPRAQLLEEQERRLRVQVARVAKASPFYRTRFADLGLEPGDIRSIEDLAGLPFTRKADIAEAIAADPPFGTHLAVPPEQIVRVHFSSGTTARPTPGCWTAADLARWTDLYARLAYSQGARAGDVFQCLFTLAWFVGGFGAMAAYTEIGAACIPAGSGDSERQIQALFDFRTTVVCGTPSFMAHLAEVASRLGQDVRTSKVRAIMLGGEPGAGVPATRRHLQELWGAKCYDGYGSLEFQPIAWECEAQEGAHLVEDFAIAEIVDPESGAPVPEGTPGVLVLTHLDKEACPLLRWWTGDVVVRDARPCACGRTHARLAGGVRGRADDMLVIRGVNVFPTAVEEVVRSTPGTTGEYLIVLDESVRDAAGFLVGFRLKVEAHAGAPGDLAERLQATVRDRLQVRVLVDVLPPETLPRSTHKARRILHEGGAP